MSRNDELAEMYSEAIDNGWKPFEANHIYPSVLRISWMQKFQIWYDPKMKRSLFEPCPIVIKTKYYTKEQMKKMYDEYLNTK